MRLIRKLSSTVRAHLRRAAQRAVAPCLVALSSACGEPPPRAAGPAGPDSVTAVDDAGQVVALPAPARRVVSLLPAGTETLLALGAGDHLVGRTRYDTDPTLAHLPSVGGGLDPSLEALTALRPELVVAWDGPTGRVRGQLAALGIPVFGIATRDTADIFRNIRNLGHLVGRDAAADSLAAAVRARLAAVSRPAGARPSVLYVVSVDPPMTAGTGNFLAELISVAGGEPIPLAGSQPGVSPQVSLEALVRLQPDLIVLPVGSGEGDAAAARLREEPGWRSLSAVRRGRIAVVPADLVNRPGPAIGETARVLAAAIDSVRSLP